jgi:CHAT domain-containing protein
MVVAGEPFEMAPRVFLGRIVAADAHDRALGEKRSDQADHSAPEVPALLVEGTTEKHLEAGKVLDGALIPPGGALMIPLITARSSAVFVLPHGITRVTDAHVIPLDRFTDEDIRTLLIGPADAPEPGGWMQAYAHFVTHPDEGLSAWFAVIKRTGQLLSEALLGPVHTRLSDWGLIEGAPVLLMPQQRLSVLPLHAAWSEVDGIKRTFLDDYAVSYVPGGAVLRVASHRHKDPHRHNQTLLAVVNPTADLESASMEGQAVAACFDPAAWQILTEAAATPEAAMHAVHGKTYLHFACHGLHDWQDPMRSGLRLAGDRPLTMAEIITRLDLSAARWVTLSACETGLIDIRHTPDEYIGLLTGFLLAVAPGVVSALWPVDDDATRLLMERFYALHLHEGLPPSQALRTAQLWLRGVAQEVSNADARYKAFRAFSTLVHEEQPSDLSYAHPWFWAGFTFTGI